MKKYGPNERADQNSNKRAKWQGDRQPIWCRVQNTGNQDAHRNGWGWSQNRGISKGNAKWNKEKCTGNQQWREEIRPQIKDLEQKEEINIQLEQNEETRIQKKKKWGEV